MLPATLVLVASFTNLLTRIKSGFCVRGSTAVCENGGVGGGGRGREGEEEGEGRGRRKGRGRGEEEEEEGGKVRREGWGSGARWEERGRGKGGISYSINKLPLWWTANCTVMDTKPK